MSAPLTAIALILAFGAGLTTCSQDEKINPNLPPVDNYKKEITDALKKLFEENETVAVRDAHISDPTLGKIGDSQRYSVCVRYTAIGLDRGVVGHAQRIGIFYGGHVNQLIEVTGGECKNAAYKPFPELNKVCLGKGCK